MIGYIAIAFAAVLAITNGLTWHYTSKHEAAKLAAFKADVAAKGAAKESENARIQAQARAGAAAAAVAARLAEAQAWAAEEERAAALARLGGVVRDLADARRVLAAGSGGSAPAYAAPLAVRTDAGGAGADPAGRLAACQADLTVLTDTLSINRVNHEIERDLRARVIKFYNDRRLEYNEREATQ